MPTRGRHILPPQGDNCAVHQDTQADLQVALSEIAVIKEAIRNFKFFILVVASLVTLVMGVAAFIITININSMGTSITNALDKFKKVEESTQESSKDRALMRQEDERQAEILREHSKELIEIKRDMLEWRRGRK